MLNPSQFYDYQKKAILHQLYNPDSMLWLGCGLGKTIVTLTTIEHRIRSGQIQKVLVFGPLRVICSVWEREARKWEHTKHLRFSVLHGSEKKRTRQLFAQADIYLCNYENMNWLTSVLEHYYTSQDKPLPFQMVVYDEITRVKNSTSMRIKGGNRVVDKGKPTEHSVRVPGWRKMIDQFQYRTGLTGTPGANGYLDLFGQYLVIDGGNRIGKYITHYKEAYFTKGYDGWSHEITDIGKQVIEDKISDITIRMDEKDYLELPPLKINDIIVRLPDKIMKRYREIERDMFTQLDDGTEFELFNRISVSNKCLQFCIAEGTQILTNSGWKNIENFENSDILWDGVEWANASGLTFQGIKYTVNLDGVFMTPDHKVLTETGWKEAWEILENETSGRFNRAKVRLPDSVKTTRFNIRKKKKSDMACRMYLWETISKNWSKLKKPKQTWDKIMRLQTWGNYFECNRVTWGVKREGRFTDKRIHNLDKHALKVPKPKGQRLQELWGKGYRCLRNLVQFFFSFLERHVVNLPKRFIYRTNRQQQRVFQRKLLLGDDERTIYKQESEHLHQYTDWENNSNRSIQEIQSKRCNHFCKNEKRMERRGFDKTSRVSKVYDLMNVGKRNRFTVKGKNGEIFIVHNCNGSPYLEPENPEYVNIHDEKLQALDSILEEAQGKTVLLGYIFKSDAERIMKRYKKLNPVNLTTTPPKQLNKVIDSGNKGKIKLMIGHPASLGHGVDGLNDFCNILVWFGLPWSLELYEQMIGRIASGQRFKKPVTMHRILCENTIDFAVSDALRDKNTTQDGLKKAIQNYRKKETKPALSFM